MHEVNIAQLKNEAQRLLQVETILLEKLQNEPDVTVNTLSGENHTFDSESIKKLIEVLQGEQTKLDGLEMVLAVVGTMKAGKSTTINAIVGTEVLPNRNTPMTTLPTLIRHTVGQTEPVLKLDNKPINDLISRINETIISQQGKENLKNLERDSDMKNLLNHIQENKQFSTCYHGVDNIFELLKNLNDLVRLSTELDVDFPYSDYDEINELPVIEIEFSHLREMKNNKLSLTLLDTPGPNESDQPQLRKIFKDQLKKASAVLAVFDFTQLKSEADADVRKELKEIAHEFDERLYALVNKFDQNDHHSESEDQIKTFVSEHLMQGIIPKNNIFPTSSLLGYLANKAKNEIYLNKKLPNHNEQSWVGEFAKKAFGSDWKDDISDIERIKKKADSLWKSSLFEKPLDSIIKKHYEKHEFFTLQILDSISSKLKSHANKLRSILSEIEDKIKSEEINVEKK